MTVVTHRRAGTSSVLLIALFAALLVIALVLHQSVTSHFTSFNTGYPPRASDRERIQAAKVWTEHKAALEVNPKLANLRGLQEAERALNSLGMVSPPEGRGLDRYTYRYRFSFRDGRVIETWGDK